MYKIGAVCVALFFIVSCTDNTDAQSGPTAWEGGAPVDTVAVEALVVTRGQLVSTISASGTVAGVNEALVVSEAQGIIRRLSVAPGQRVREGQELLKIDDTIAALNVQRAKDQLDSALLDLRANEQLAESGGSSTAALIRARSAASAARAQYETALKAFNDTTVRSPISGIVATRADGVTVGNVISAFTRVARVVDNSSFKITVGLGEREIGLVRNGNPVSVSIPSALGSELVDGIVESTGGGSDPSTGSYSVIISFANKWDNLVKSGMSASVEITTSAREPAIVIPLSALLRRNERYAVFVVKDNTVQVREVMPGQRSGVRTEILSGLAEGEHLVISGLSRLRDGTPVAVTLRGNSSERE